MPLTVASVFNFIPVDLWRPLKKFVTKDRLVVFDLPFKMSTKYTPALLIVFMCLSFANQFVRNIELDCSTNGFGGKGNAQNGYGTSESSKELNDFCWNHETFLVARALEPHMRRTVTYPGVSGYDRGVDEVLNQRYYKYVWLIFGQLTVISFLPYFFWKARATKKIKPLVTIIDSVDYSEEDQRLNYFLETVGFNGSFAWFYVMCKIFAAVSPIGQWYYLCGFIGGRFKYYGIDVLSHFMDTSAPWPNPMDALFPKMAKCEWSRYGYGGDMEIKSAQCQMPMNNLTQWSFFIFWLWIAVIFIVNMLSLLYLFFHMFPFCRRYKYRKFVGNACRDDVEKLRTYAAAGSNGKGIIKKHNRSKIIYINMDFGDWLVLSFVKKNMEEWKFRDLVRKLATTENMVIQLKPVPIPLPMPIPAFSSLNEKNKENPDDEEGHKAATMEIGFKQSLINQIHNKIHPTDYAYETGSTDFDNINKINESFLSPSPEEFPIKITAPVKIDRKHLNSKVKPNATEKVVNKKNKHAPVPTHRNPHYGWKPPGGAPQPPNPEQYDEEHWEGRY